MAFSPAISWQTEWERPETVIEFLFLGSKTTADGVCSHEIKKKKKKKEKEKKRKKTIISN